MTYIIQYWIECVVLDMKDTIEVIDKDTNKKQIYVLKEEPQEEVQQNGFWFDTFPVIVEITIELVIKLFKFSLYLIISFLELLIKIIKKLFLDDYRPFGAITDSRNNFLNRIAQKEVNKEKIRFATQYMCRHEYSFNRSREFDNAYKQIQQRLKDIAEHNITLNNELYKDTMYQINALVVEAEKVAMKESYAYAKKTKYGLDEENAYDNYIRDKIMQGESNRKFRVEED